jgi:hydroxymethylpyrimidine/phosphomethylpyrimidine kinase
VFHFSRTFRGVNTDFFFNFSDIFLISPTSDPSDFLLNRAVRAVSSAVGAILVKGLNRRTHFWKRTIQWLFHQNLFLLSKWFQKRRFLWEFPIGSYVKLSSAVAAILVKVLKCRTQFWKRTTQESFQQSLVEIGSVVSEEKNFF